MVGKRHLSQLRYFSINLGWVFLTITNVCANIRIFVKIRFSLVFLETTRQNTKRARTRSKVNQFTSFRFRYFRFYYVSYVFFLF